jgi:PPP family 3-phenylpropionic acid transporter
MARYWNLSRFYFFYFASLGALIPFWSVYLNSLEFSPLEIGQLMATLAVSKVVAPYLWGWLADRSGYHVRVVQFTSLFSLLCFLPLLWFDSFTGLLAFMLLFSFFWNASLPQFEVVTLNRLGQDSHKYSRIRLWGSLGFILTVILLGMVFEHAAIGWLPAILLAIFGLIWLSTLAVSEQRQRVTESANIVTVLRQPAVIGLFVSCFLIQASHGPYYTFYSLFMEDLGYSRTAVGQLWALGVLSEVGLFLVMHHLFRLRSAGFWLVVALALTTLRWWLMAYFSDSLPLVLLMQCLHAASFGMYHAAAIYLVHRYFPQHHGRGQALYSAVSFGAGGAVGSLYAGTLWQDYGAQTTFSVAALLALIGMLVAWQANRIAQREPA